MKYLIKLILICSCLLLQNKTLATEEPVNASKKTTLGLYLTSKEAYKMKLKKKSKVLFIDVRTRAEVAFLGMANAVDANIPYMIVGDWDEWDDKKSNFKLYPNSNFLPYFNDYIEEHGFNKDSPIILICRSGNRSAAASNLLAQVGYKRVYSIVDGFEGEKVNKKTDNGWKNSGLPWGTHLEEEKMYMEF